MTDSIYISVQFGYKGFKDNLGFPKASKVLTTADSFVKKALVDMVNTGRVKKWVHEYSWTDGSLYKWVELYSTTDIQQCIADLDCLVRSTSSDSVYVSQHRLADPNEKPYKFDIKTGKDYKTLKEYFEG